MKLKQKLRRVFLRRNKSGYTLVEVIVASALLAVLMVGITMFIGPVMSNVASNEKNARASNVAENVQYYISRNLRNAAFVAIFNGASLSDFTEQAVYNTTGTIQNTILAKSTTGSMPDFVSKQKSASGAEIYELRCMSIRKQVDAKSGETKYFIYDESFSTGADTLKTNGSTLVFEQCFYEGIYMNIDFAHVEKSTGGTAGTDETVVTPPPATPITTEYRPALEIKINVYDDEGMDASSMIFSGKGYTELINIKYAQDNASMNLPYKIYHTPGEDFPTNIGAGTDTFIFYVVRKFV